ncbi:MAG: hypothetical protein IJD39_07545 [Clostridia bacterium]|nr:hypothetical protein [Clostridia bacterium]
MRVKILAFFLALILFMSVLLPAYSKEKPKAIDQIDDSMMISGYREAPGVGTFRYYAQNDPTWGQMEFYFPHLKNNHPSFSGAGCVPTATANLIANMVDRNQLPSLSGISWKGDGFYICPCSMNRYECDHTHSRFRITTAQDFDKYLCLVIGSYYSGNNKDQNYSCGTLYMFGKLMKHFGLRYEYNVTIQKAARAVEKEGAMAVFMVGGDGNVFTSSGHALTLCAATDDTLYILDSFARTQDEYKNNHKQMLRVIEPGMVAFDRNRIERLGAYQVHLVYPNP